MLRNIFIHLHKMAKASWITMKFQFWWVDMKWKIVIFGWNIKGTYCIEFYEKYPTVWRLNSQLYIYFCPWRTLCILIQSSKLSASNATIVINMLWIETLTSGMEDCFHISKFACNPILAGWYWSNLIEPYEIINWWNRWAHEI